MHRVQISFKNKQKFPLLLSFLLRPRVLCPLFSLLLYIRADNLCIWQTTEDKNCLFLLSSERLHNSGPLKELCLMCAICLGDVYVCIWASLICWACFVPPPCQFSRPTPTLTHTFTHTHTQAHKKRRMKFSYLDCVDRRGWRRRREAESRERTQGESLISVWVQHL